MKKLTLVSFISSIIFVLINESTSAPSEKISTLLPNNLDQRSRVEESHLERVHLKQDTGFDGKVRSIRFSLESEQDKSASEKSLIEDNDVSKFQRMGLIDTSNPASIVDPKSTDLSGTSLRSKKTGSNSQASMKLVSSTSLDRITQNISEPLKIKRSIDKNTSDNKFEDLQAEESKVFRPLFVYRQQVARRLKLRNDRTNYGHYVRSQRKNSPYYYYPYNYPYYY